MRLLLVTTHPHRHVSTQGLCDTRILNCLQMREDAEELGIHAGEREQQDLDIESDARKNKEAFKPARHSEDTRLRDWHRS